MSGSGSRGVEEVCADSNAPAVTGVRPSLAISEDPSLGSAPGDDDGTIISDWGSVVREIFVMRRVSGRKGSNAGVSC